MRVHRSGARVDPSRFDHLVKLSISSDRLEASLVIEPGLDDSEETRKAVMGLLERRGVEVTDERVKAMEQALRRYHAGGRKRLEMQVAYGIAPQHGRDERLELSEEIVRARQAPLHSVDSRDRVDHYSRSVFCVVGKGQVVGRLHPPTKGVPGVDIGGAPVPARDGKPIQVRIDPSLRVEPSGEIVAEIDGLLEHTESLIKVVPELYIAENVDFSTGNIKFPGNVRIDRSVRDCFVVECGETLEVNGLVEAANITTGLDARLNHGMAAREKGRIQIGRDLHAKYLDNVHGVVARDLLVAREIRKSTLVVGRRVLSPTCTVMGGSITAAAECQLAQIGGEGEGPCEIALGKIPALEDLVKGLLDAMGVLAKRIKNTDPRLESARKLQVQHEDIASRILRTLSFLRGHTVVDLTVDGLLYPGTTIWAGPLRAELLHAAKGPIRIWLDESGVLQVTDVTAKRTVPLEGFAKVSRESRYMDVAMLHETLQRGSREAA